MDSAMWGYGVEVGTHVVRMMAAGVFDRFPKLKICIGHMGEAIPFWIWRVTFMNSRAQAIGRAPKTQLTMEEYFRRNSCSPPAAWRIRWRSTTRSSAWESTMCYGPSTTPTNP